METAHQWRQQLGQERNAKWERRLEHLASPPVLPGLYINVESLPEQWTGQPDWKPTVHNKE